MYDGRFCQRLAFGMTLAAFVLFCSCSKKPEQDLFPAGSPMANSIRFQYAVYMLPIHRKDPSIVLSNALRSYPRLKLVTESPKDPREMTVSGRMQENVQKEYAPPSVESLQYFGRGTSRDQAQALRKSEEAFILEFAHPKENVWTALKAANLLVEEIARSTGGLIWDEDAREMFSPDAWHEKRLASWIGDVPDISTQTVIHVYKDDEFVRAITLGMAKAGLPDVVVGDFLWSENNQVGNLINLFSQSMVEGAVFDKPGRFNLNLRAIKNVAVRDPQLKTLKANASGVACLALKPGVREEGDPENRLIQLTSDRYAGNDLHAKRDKMLGSLFGWEDSAKRVQHSEELLEASRKARAKLPELQKAFNAGLQPGEFVQVKAPFRTPEGGNEWMWVEVSHWEGNRIKGLLENDPVEVPDLHGGQLVEVRGEDVFDYIHQFPDKHMEGNTTGDILRRMDQEKDTRPERVLAEPVSDSCSSD